MVGNIRKQMGQKGMCREFDLNDAKVRKKKKFKECKVDSPKVITYHKLPGQQA